MPEYRRAYIPGGTVFLTLVTYRRTPLFSEPETITRLRAALAQTRTEKPFEIIGAVVEIAPSTVPFMKFLLLIMDVLFNLEKYPFLISLPKYNGDYLANQLTNYRFSQILIL